MTITVDWLRMMARFSRWRTERMIASCDTLDDAARKQDRGLFFGTIHSTVDHVLWADRIWLWRFDAAERPAARSIADSTQAHPDWTDLKAARAAFDQQIVAWADGLDDASLGGALVWDSGATGKRQSQPRWLAATHLFNHQTHHYGQVHAALTQAGVKPMDWDLVFAPADITG